MILTLPCGRTCLLDDADAPLIAGRRWFAAQQKDGKHYARGERFRGDPRVYMHRLIMGVTAADVLVDHRNGNGLDNTRNNLREGTVALNNRNVRKRARRKPFKGVYRTKSGRFFAKIEAAGNAFHSRGHETAEAAARAYDELARRHHGDWARPNFPEVAS